MKHILSDYVPLFIAISGAPLRSDHIHAMINGDKKKDFVYREFIEFYNQKTHEGPKK